MMAAVDSAFLRSRASDRHSSTAFIMCLLFQQAKAVPRIYAEAECLALPAHIQVTENISRGDIDSANIDSCGPIAHPRKTMRARDSQLFSVARGIAICSAPRKENLNA
jgi:hypothetical protein